MRHRSLLIRLARLVPSIVLETLIFSHRNNIPWNAIVMKEQVRHGRGEESRLGGRDADFLRGGAAGGHVALEENVAAGDALEGCMR